MNLNEGPRDGQWGRLKTKKGVRGCDATGLESVSDRKKKKVRVSLNNFDHTSRQSNTWAHEYIHLNILCDRISIVRIFKQVQQRRHGLGGLGWPTFLFRVTCHLSLWRFHCGFTNFPFIFPFFMGFISRLEFTQLLKHANLCGFTYARFTRSLLLSSVPVYRFRNELSIAEERELSKRDLLGGRTVYWTLKSERLLNGLLGFLDLENPSWTLSIFI